MNRVLRIDEEKPEVAVLVKQALLSAYAMPQK